MTQCRHGQLARQCEICELEAALSAEIAMSQEARLDYTKDYKDWSDAMAKATVDKRALETTLAATEKVLLEERIARNKADADKRALVEALQIAKDSLYNPFEPDNQSNAYHVLGAALEGFE